MNLEPTLNTWNLLKTWGKKTTTEIYFCKKLHNFLQDYTLGAGHQR